MASFNFFDQIYEIVIDDREQKMFFSKKERSERKKILSYIIHLS